MEFDAVCTTDFSPFNYAEGNGLKSVVVYFLR
jgi:hypothetical protein